MTPQTILVKTNESRHSTDVDIYDPVKLLGQIEGTCEEESMFGKLDAKTWQWMTGHLWNLIDAGKVQMIPAPMDSRYYFFKLHKSQRRQNDQQNR